MHPSRLLIATMALSACAWVLAQNLTAGIPQSTWVFINKQGVKTYSDVPPPPDTPANKILQRPDQAPSAGTGAAAPADVASVAARPARPAASGKDAEIEKKLAEKKEQEAAKEKAENEAAEAKRKVACANLKQNAVTLNSGVRLSRVNAKGEREVMDDAQRAEALKKNQERLADC